MPMLGRHLERQAVLRTDNQLFCESLYLALGTPCTLAESKFFLTSSTVGHLSIGGRNEA